MDQAAVIEAQLPQYDVLEQPAREQRQADQTISSIQESKERLAREIQSQKNQLHRKDESLQKLTESSLSLEGLQASREKLQQRERQLKDFALAIDDLKKESELAEQARHKYLQARAASEEVERDHQALRRAYLDAQAGILAQDLQEDQPCPVCGSLDHPRPARMPEQTPTESQLKKAEKEAARKAKEAADASQHAAAAASRAETLYRELEKKTMDDIMTES